MVDGGQTRTQAPGYCSESAEAESSLCCAEHGGEIARLPTPPGVVVFFSISKCLSGPKSSGPRLPATLHKEQTDAGAALSAPSLARAGRGCRSGELRRYPRGKRGWLWDCSGKNLGAEAAHPASRVLFNLARSRSPPKQAPRGQTGRNPARCGVCQIWRGRPPVCRQHAGTVTLACPSLKCHSELAPRRRRQLWARRDRHSGAAVALTLRRHVGARAAFE